MPRHAEETGRHYLWRVSTPRFNDSNWLRPARPRFEWRQEPDHSVQWIVRGLSFLALISPYQWVVCSRPKLGPRFAVLYVGLWLLFLGGLYFSWPLWSVVVSFAILRWIDVIRWWLLALLDRRHNVFVSFERNLVFLGLNFAELVLISAVMLRATGLSPERSQALTAGFFLSTQLNVPHTPRGATLYQQISEVVGAGSGLILLLGGLAMVVAGIGQKFREGNWIGPI